MPCLRRYKFHNEIIILFNKTHLTASIIQSLAWNKNSFCIHFHPKLFIIQIFEEKLNCGFQSKLKYIGMIIKKIREVKDNLYHILKETADRISNCSLQ